MSFFPEVIRITLQAEPLVRVQFTLAGISCWQTRTKGVEDHIVLRAKNKDLESRVKAEVLFQQLQQLQLLSPSQ